jgi:hypothetical protein
MESKSNAFEIDLKFETNDENISIKKSKNEIYIVGKSDEKDEKNNIEILIKNETITDENKATKKERNDYFKNDSNPGDLSKKGFIKKENNNREYLISHNVSNSKTEEENISIMKGDNSYNYNEKKFPKYKNTYGENYFISRNNEKNVSYKILSVTEHTLKNR